MKINIPQQNIGNYTIPYDCNKEVCVDVGANVGSFTCAQASTFKILHFYEPYLPCFNIVKEKTVSYNNVVGWNEAVYKEDNLELSIVAHENMDAGSNALLTDSVNDTWQHEIQKTKTVSLPTILDRVGGYINYLKLDCETSEYYFLIDQDLSNIDYIGAELHWQMGLEKYNKLLEHIKVTHIVVGDYNWHWGLNKEVLFKNKMI